VEIFEYVVVLTSIVLGLAVTHLMQGVATLIQHPGRHRVWWVHLGWVVFWLFTSVFWWWWEFRLQTITTWTFQLYLFVIAYAFLLYLISAVLFPKDLEGYEGFKDYFLSRRRWFYGLMLVDLAMDLVDTYAKGRDYFVEQGAPYLGVQAVLVTVCVAGFATRRSWVHETIILIALAIQIVRAVAMYDSVA
jgi:hypothetical protein